MARQTYKSVIPRLWAQLGLPPPVVGDELHILLSVDEFELPLSDSPDGNTLVIEAFVEVIEGSAAHDLTLMERLMKTVLALATVRDVVVSLEVVEAGAPRLMVRGYYPYKHNDISMLVERVFDVVAGVETLRGIMPRSYGGRGTVDPRLGVAAPTDHEAFVVFRP